MLRKILQVKIPCRSKRKPAENKFDIGPVHTTPEEFQNIAFLSPSRGGSCSHDPLIFLNCIPCSLLINPLFSSCYLDPQTFLRRSLDFQKYLSFIAVFVACFAFLLVEKNSFWAASFFSLRSAHAVLYSFLSIQLSRLPLRQ